MIRRLLLLFFLIVPSAFGVETLVVDSLTRNIINLGAVNFATGQLKVNNVAVVGGAGSGGGGGGGTGTIDNIRLNLPPIMFATPVDFTVSGGLAEGTVLLTPQVAGTILANLSGGSATPTFVTLAALKNAMGVDQVNNTSDVNKPISALTQAALDTLTTNVTANTTAISTLNGAVAVKADTATVNAALALKANITYVDGSVATRQPYWGLPPTNGYIAAGNTDGSLFWVDPTTLGGGSGGGGGVGTVTSVSSGSLPLSVGTFFTSTVTSPSSSAGINYFMTNAPAQTFFGNSAGLTGPPSYMDATTARGALGGTTVGQNLFTLTNPSQIRFLQINANNSVSALSDISFRSAIGAGTVSTLAVTNNLTPNAPFGVSITNPSTTPTLVFDPVNVGANTFYGNSSGSAAAPTFMNAITARGSLGGTTVGQNLFTLANPSAITYPRISATNTVTALTPAQVLSDIGGVATSDSRFPASVVGIRKSAGLASTDTAATANIDYAKNSETTFTNTGGNVTGSPVTWPDGATAGRQTAALDQNRYTLLPHANAYAPGTRLTYTDATTAFNFGRFFRRQGTDLLNESSTDVLTFIAGNFGPYSSKSVEFITDGVSRWRLISTASTAFHVEDPIDAAKQFTFDASLQSNTGSPVGIVKAALGTSVTIAPTTTGGLTSDPIFGVLRDISDAGQVSKSRLSPYELLPVENAFDPSGDPSPHIVPTTLPYVDTVRIIGTMPSTPYTIIWPRANLYETGARVALIDSSGTVGPANPVTIKSNDGDQFSGSFQFTLDESYGSKVLVSDGNGNWFLPVTKTSIQGFAVLTANGMLNTFTIDGASSAVKHNAHLGLAAGTNTLVINNPYDGMSIELVLEQKSASNGKLNLPAVSKVGSTGAGVITTSTGAGKLDRLRGIYDAQAAAFLWDPLLTDHTTAPAATVPAGFSATVAVGAASSSTINLAWTDSSNETSYQIYRAAGLAQTTGFSLIRTVGAAASGTVTYADSNLSPAHDYTYTVTACNAAGCSNQATPDDASTTSGAISADLLEWHLNDGVGGTASLVASTGSGPTGTNYKTADWTTSTLNANPAAFAALQGMAPFVGANRTATNVGGGTGTTWTYRVLAFKNGLHNGCTDVTVANNATLDATHLNRIGWSTITGATSYEVYRVSPNPGHLTGSTATAAGTFDDANGTTANTDGSGTLVAGGSTDFSRLLANANVAYPVSPDPNGRVVTISFWARSTFAPSPDATTQLISLNPGVASGSATRVQAIGSSKLQISMAGSTGQLNATVLLNVDPAGLGNNVNSGTGWHHIVIVLDNSTIGNTPTMTSPTCTATSSGTASDNIRVYFDGNHQQTLSFIGTCARVGPRNFTPDTFQVGLIPSFSGNYDDIRIYSGALGTGLNGALDTTQIGNIYTAGPQ